MEEVKQPVTDEYLAAIRARDVDMTPEEVAESMTCIKKIGLKDFQAIFLCSETTEVPLRLTAHDADPEMTLRTLRTTLAQIIRQDRQATGLADMPAARTDIPALLAEIDRLRAEVAEGREELEALAWIWLPSVDKRH